MAKRGNRHGKNWRQIFVNCGGMCIKCGNVSCLEFHEPFGEDNFGWGIMQSRILLCNDCHTEEHGGERGSFNGKRAIKPSALSEDMEIEILLHGGYDNWIKDFNLEDTFGRLLIVSQ